MVSRLALRGRWPQRIILVLDAGRPAGDALHVVAERHRTDDAHGQTGLERGTHPPHQRRAGCTLDLAPREATPRGNALSPLALSTRVAMARAAATAANAAMG